MKTLIIAEKPSVARDIAAALGGGFSTESFNGCDYLERDDLLVSSAVGHLLGLECPKEDDPGYDLFRLPAIPRPFALAPKEKTTRQLKLLGKLMSRSDVEAVVNACDAGREGELIFRYIAVYNECRKPMYRMWLQSMTPAAIMAAYADMSPAHDWDNLFGAAQCRAEADWLIGINGSRGVSILYQAKTGRRSKNTVGRVQSPVVALLVERELAIKNFVAKDYFEVIATLSSGPLQYVAKWTDLRFKADPAQPDAKADRFFDRRQAEAIAAKCRGHQPSSVTDDTKDVSVNPPKLFDLTSLQREANKRFGLSASNTLKIAQALYETQKVLTYPRTESNCLPEDYVSTVVNTLTRISQAQHPMAMFAATAIPNVRPDKRIFNNAKISDHFAIIPTGKIPVGLTDDQAKIYDLVLRRFIAIFYPPAVFQQTVRTTLINGETFRSSGRVLSIEGWLVVDGKGIEDDEDEKQPSLCRLAPGQVLPVNALNINTSKTRPPPRYTEASLLGAMESAGAVIEDEELREAMKARGLGTPATRAATIEHLLDPEVAYIVRQKKNLLPTPKAFDLIDFLKTNGLAFLTAAQTTGEWEFALLQMEEGKYTRQAFMEGIYQMTHAIIDRVKQSAAALPGGLDSLIPVVTEVSTPCPRCNGVLTADASALMCQCGFKLWRSICGINLTDEQCTLLLTTRAHPPISGFKSTKSKNSFAAGLALASDMSGKVEFVFEDRLVPLTTTSSEASPHSCPTCGKPMRRRTKGNSAFWGCTDYPKCKKTLPDKNGEPAI